MFHIKLQILARSVFDDMAQFVIYLRIILFEMYVQFGGGGGGVILYELLSCFQVRW
jgi:hypothetical protein